MVSVIGALAILATYAANQLGWTAASNLPYQVATTVSGRQPRGLRDTRGSRPSS